MPRRWLVSPCLASVLALACEEQPVCFAQVSEVDPTHHSSEHERGIEDVLAYLPDSQAKILVWSDDADALRKQEDNKDTENDENEQELAPTSDLDFALHYRAGPIAFIELQENIYNDTRIFPQCWDRYTAEVELDLVSSDGMFNERDVPANISSAVEGRTFEQFGSIPYVTFLASIPIDKLQGEFGKGTTELAENRTIHEILIQGEFSGNQLRIQIAYIGEDTNGIRPRPIQGLLASAGQLAAVSPR